MVNGVLWPLPVYVCLYVCIVITLFYAASLVSYLLENTLKMYVNINEALTQ